MISDAIDGHTVDFGPLSADKSYHTFAGQLSAIFTQQ